MHLNKKYGIIGVAGFVAPRHCRAMRDTGGELVAALDPSDSVGMMDSYFPRAQFFTEFERFDRFVDKERRCGNSLDYMTICSPNYLHDAHVRFALRSGCDAICEKPLVLNPWNINGLAEIEEDTGRRVNTILQLRLHPSILALRDKIQNAPADKIFDVDLTYITSRGQWYHASWKGDTARSGGVATNIGVHFFDMLEFVFGKRSETQVYLRDDDRVAGYLTFQRARVRWFLSIDSDDLPKGLESENRTFREIVVDGDAFEFSNGFTDLHTESYRQIHLGNGFGLADVRPSIETVSIIRNAEIDENRGDECHPAALDYFRRT